MKKKSKKKKGKKVFFFKRIKNKMAFKCKHTKS